MADDPWVEVEFRGLRLWVRADVLRGETDGPLSPPDHIRDGKLDHSTCFGSDSYAHVYTDGRGVMRYHETIGTLADLVPVGRVAVIPAPAETDRV